MGCPPDPADVYLWQSQEKIDELQIKYDELRKQYAITADLWNKTSRGKNSNENQSKFEACTFSREAGVQPTESDPYADATDIDKKVKKYLSIVKEVEVALCDLRDQLLVEAKNESNALTQQEKQTEHDLHLAHREDDRQVWLAWLQDKVEMCEFIIQDDDPYPDTEKTKKLKNKLTKEIKRVTAITPDELFGNTQLFGIHPEEFDTYSLYDDI